MSLMSYVGTNYLVCKKYEHLKIYGSPHKYLDTCTYTHVNTYFMHPWMDELIIPK